MVNFLRKREALQPFIIFCHARSSSSRLIRTLQQHPKIHCAGEIFNKKGDWAQTNYVIPLFGKAQYESDLSPDEFLWEFYKKAAKHDNKAIVGFKIFIDHQPANLQRKWILDRRIKKILLSRRNMLQAGLSFQLASQTKQYAKRPGKDVELPQPFEVNVKHMRNWIERNNEWLQECRELLRASRQEYYECAYEDFNPQVTKEIFEYLGVNPISEFQRYHEKMAQREHYNRIQNLDEVRAAFEGAEFGFVDELIGEQVW